MSFEEKQYSGFLESIRSLKKISDFWSLQCSVYYWIYGELKFTVTMPAEPIKNLRNLCKPEFSGISRVFLYTYNAWVFGQIKNLLIDKMGKDPVFFIEKEFIRPPDIPEIFFVDLKKFYAEYSNYLNCKI